MQQYCTSAASLLEYAHRRGKDQAPDHVIEPFDYISVTGACCLPCRTLSGNVLEGTFPAAEFNALTNLKYL